MRELLSQVLRSYIALARNAQRMPHRDLLDLRRTRRAAGNKILATNLLRLEVFNPIHRRRHAGAVSELLAEELVSVAMERQFTCVSEDWLHPEALQTAGSFGQKASSMPPMSRSRNDSVPSSGQRTSSSTTHCIHI
jgi:hypothetical protein